MAARYPWEGAPRPRCRGAVSHQSGQGGPSPAHGVQTRTCALDVPATSGQVAAVVNNALRGAPRAERGANGGQEATVVRSSEERTPRRARGRSVSWRPGRPLQTPRPGEGKKKGGPLVESVGRPGKAPRLRGRHDPRKFQPTITSNDDSHSLYGWTPSTEPEPVRNKQFTLRETLFLQVRTCKANRRGHMGHDSRGTTLCNKARWSCELRVWNRW